MIRARLVVASLTPCGTDGAEGMLATWPQLGSRQEQPTGSTEGAPGVDRRNWKAPWCKKPATWGTPAAQLAARDSGYGTVNVTAWTGLHPKLAARHDPRPGPVLAILHPPVRHEHAIKFQKATLGWVTPSLRHPGQADRWTAIIFAAYAQLVLARPLAADQRLPWERPATRPCSPQAGCAAISREFARSCRQ
jgi:hypothetical protein